MQKVYISEINFHFDQKICNLIVFKAVVFYFETPGDVSPKCGIFHTSGSEWKLPHNKDKFDIKPLRIG